MITAAAAIMVVVFLAFVASPEVFLKLFGIGLAAAIFLDATVVRMVLVPAVMQLLDHRNWWIPSLAGADPAAARRRAGRGRRRGTALGAALFRFRSDPRRRVAMMNRQRVAVGIGEEGLVADAGVERVRFEFHAARFQLRPRRGNILDPELDRVGVGAGTEARRRLTA